MTRNQFMPLAVAAFLACSGAMLRAEVTLPKVFGDHMVLQRDMPVPVWGWAEKAKQVTVTFAGQEKRAVADENGKWRVTLDPMKACKEPRELTVSAGNTVVFKDVAVGEVWLCSGQSNMQMLLGSVKGFDFRAEVKATPSLVIRHLKIPWRGSCIPCDDASNLAWTERSPDTTATGYFFARELARELDVPVGLINATWGGTPIEPWTAPSGFEAVAELRDIIPQYAVWDMPTSTTPRGRTSTTGKACPRRRFGRTMGWLEPAAGDRSQKALGSNSQIASDVLCVKMRVDGGI